ncbi:MAG: hypothetical protein ACLR6J_09750 [Parabacteroides merdae]
MKITDVKVWLVRGIKYNWTLLKIYTDEGYTGVGEATNWPGSPIVSGSGRQACRITHHFWPRPDEDRFYLDEALPRPELDRLRDGVKACV